MAKNSLAQIRDKFIDYFVKNSHSLVPSSSLIPYNDPTLMFVNSGMVPFKNIFTGKESREYERAVSCQKSIRAGGKHNDLENVGYTSRHHTFFEMLGNFSFGNYFKEEAIYYAFNLLTKEFGIPANKLYATVYHTDEEAIKYWKKIANFGDDKVIKIKTNDNFWTMGETGPCGPCSEIFYDHGEYIYGGLPGTANENGDRYIEIWNMVFMEFEQGKGGTLSPLPQKSIDTGMGLERVAAVLQGVHDNYDIDLFRELINSFQDHFRVKYTGKSISSYRVIADHLRSISFLIADGIMPSNEGRGYVLRRIMRRCMNHAYQLSNREPVIYKLLPKLVELMSSAYPELKSREDFISDAIRQEEIRFQITLDRGLKLLDQEIGNTHNEKLKGGVAFKLYDTYGFPLDLTTDILRSKNIEVDLDGFNACMLEQKEKARKAWAGSGEKLDSNIWFNIKSKFGSTEFLGYITNEVEAIVISLINGEIQVNEINELGNKFILISNQTVFYGESGGQMGDVGVIENDKCKINVINTLKYLGSIHAHICVLERGKISLGESIKLSINLENRNNLAIHHSATHILHAALRKLLGNHVVQKGSLVTNSYLRFDFSHNKALTKEEIYQIEDEVNNIIRNNSEVSTELLSKEDAIEKGALALFGEKYDNEVRVISMKERESINSNYSYEFCGGTHVNRTGDIGVLKIISENGISAGVRRIEAICGKFVLKYIRDEEILVKDILDILKSNKNEAVERITGLRAYIKHLEKEFYKHKLAELDISKEEIDILPLSKNGYKIIYKLIEKFDISLMRDAAQNLVKKSDNLIVIYVNKESDRVTIVVCISKKLSEELNAGEIIRKISVFLEGVGGGSRILAQGSGNRMDKLPELSLKIEQFIS